MQSSPKPSLKPCRECQHEISAQARACPNCGAPHPARDTASRGYEYRSPLTILGFPLLHVSFKYLANGRPVPAVGFVSIGQFGAGVITISQFGVGVVSVSQFAVAGFALAQIAVAWDLIAQIGLYLHSGRGQVVASLAELLEQLG